MSKKAPKGTQTDAINRYSPQVQVSFDLVRLDAFVTGLGVDFAHFKATPSPIGKKDRGDYRKSDGVDVMTSNGMIYRFAGLFTATMTDNDRKQKRSEGGVLDPSEARLVLPRFYNKPESGDTSDGARIYLMPGDRLYVADPDADVLVETAQEVDYDPTTDNDALFPIVELEGSILDSNNTEYTQNFDFAITAEGRIRWLTGGKNPGIDPTTGKGRIYSIRYRYKAYWYVVALPKEIRVTNVTAGGVRAPQRMPYHAIVVREFVFHNQNRGDKTNQLKPANPARVTAAPQESINPNKFTIPVDMSTISDDED